MVGAHRPLFFARIAVIRSRTTPVGYQVLPPGVTDTMNASLLTPAACNQPRYAPGGLAFPPKADFGVTMPRRRRCTWIEHAGKKARGDLPRGRAPDRFSTGVGLQSGERGKPAR